MKNYLVRSIVGIISFFFAYTLIDYLLDDKIDWTMVIAMTIGYGIGLTVYYFYQNRKNGK